MKPKERFTGYNHNLCEASKRLRKNMTRQERRLWYDFLRNYPVKIYRQRPVDRFILDFYCSKARLAIEVDGNHHSSGDQFQYDVKRTALLHCYGIEVLRIRNFEIDNSFASVCRIIDQRIQERLPSS